MNNRCHILLDTVATLQQNEYKSILDVIRTVVPPNKAVTVLGLELTVHIFFRLLHGNIHVAIEARQYAPVLDARVQLDTHRTTKDGFEKVGRRALLCSSLLYRME